jgi:putative phosphoribosyl transferase
MGTVRILSDDSNPFADRHEAGRLLANVLSGYAGTNPVVLGIPRGGIVIAWEIARGIGGELDIILARKLRTPGHEELAMGSVAEDGAVFLNREVVRSLDPGSPAVEREWRYQVAEIQRRLEILRRVRPRVEFKGRTVIVADDGIATGSTTQAALRAAHAQGPRRLIAAMPVGPEHTIRMLADDVDEIICLRAPPSFAAVGQFYLNFDPVEDEDVVHILTVAAGRMPSGQGED